MGIVVANGKTVKLCWSCPPFTETQVDFFGGFTMRDCKRITEGDMMNACELYRLLQIDKELVAKFSIFFSRFEYALKRTIKYAKKMDRNGVMANWDEFAKTHKTAFKHERTPELKSAVDYIYRKPPKRQIIREGTLGWEDVEYNEPLSLQQILCSVRRVRNNLFHGGKFPSGPVEDPSRDTQLLESCMIILEECLGLDSELSSYFGSFET